MDDRSAKPAHRLYLLSSILYLLFVSPLLAAGPQVTVHKIDDTAVSGTLSALTGGKIILKSPAATIPLEDLSDLTTTAAAAPAVAAAAVPHKLTGKVIGTDGSWNDDADVTKDKAFDGDMDTYFDCPNGTGNTDAWVGLDLGAPATITEIKFAPRPGGNLFQRRMVGGKFQGSSSADFSTGVTTLFTITKLPQTGTLTSEKIANPTKFRYVRYFGPLGGCCNVAEIEFWGTESSAPAVKGTAMPTTAAVKANAPRGARTKATVVASATRPAAPPPAIAPPTTKPAASQPAQNPAKTFSVTFGDDDHLSGSLNSWTDKSLTLQPTPIPAGIEIPVSTIREVWRGTPEQVTQAKALPLEAGPEDAAFVVKDTGVVAVRGITLGIDGESLRFKFNDEEKKIALAKLVGVIFGGTDSKRDRSFRQSVQLAGDNTISGKWIAFDATRNSMALQTSWGKKLDLPFASVQKIRSANGRLTYLSDLKPAAVEQVAYFDRLLPYRIDKSLTGGTIKLIDGDYQHGISVHSRCVLTYDLAGEYAEFKTKVGFQQPEGKAGQAAIRVIGDGKTLWENPDARGDAPKPAEVSLKINGVKQLILEVDFGKDGDTGDRVAWANARLLRAAAK